MSQINYTPGPWRVHELDGSQWIAPTDPNADVIADLLGCSDDQTNAANAHLIATAPELLESLEELLEFAVCTPDSRGHLDKALAAIKKARGEAS